MRRRSTKARTPQVPSVAENVQKNGTSKYGDVVWVEIDDVRVPCFVRNGRPYGPVRILEHSLLNRLSATAVNAAFRNRRLLVSQYITEFEAQLLSYAVGSHFTVDDLAVDVEEFRALYMHIVSELQKKSPTAQPSSSFTGGWLQVNNR